MSVDSVITDPCILFALRRESMYFRRHFPFRQRFLGAPCPAQFRGSSSRTVLMLETGVGAAAMENALRWCLSTPRFGEIAYRPRFVLSMGFSGALQPDQRVGDLVSATEIIDLGNREQGTGNSSRYSPVPCSLFPVPCREGRLLTVSELVSDPREKQRLGERYGALAVDMETAVIARFCEKHDIPLLCLRVISDDLNTPLSPHLAALLRHGRVSPTRLAWAIVRHPSLIWQLWRLAGQTRFAAHQLQAGLGKWLASADWWGSGSVGGRRPLA